VEEAVEDGEVGEEVFFEHAFEVEFDEALSDQPGGIAEQAQDASVRDDAVEVLGEVEVFLKHRVGRHARAGAVVTALVEGIVPAEQMQGQTVAAFVGMGDGIGLAVDVLAFAGIDGAVAELGEERDQPEVAGLGS